MSTASPAPPSSGKSAAELKIQVADLILKVVGAALLMVGGWLGVLKYFDDRQQQRDALAAQHDAALTQSKYELAQRQKEFRVRFYEHQLAQYFAISDAAARLATAKNMGDVQKELREFQILYWGKLCIVESPGVEAAQRKLHDALSSLVKDQAAEMPQQVRELCYALAHACRDDLRDTFQTGQGELPPTRNK